MNKPLASCSFSFREYCHTKKVEFREKNEYFLDPVGDFSENKNYNSKKYFSQNCVSEAPPENEYYDRLEIVPNLIYTRHVVFFYIYKCFTIFTRYTDISRKKK